LTGLKRNANIFKPLQDGLNATVWFDTFYSDDDVWERIGWVNLLLYILVNTRIGYHWILD